MAFRSGFVNIIGNTNVGKSTLLNRLTGEKLAIVTPKAQTTRHRILGILNGEGYQIIFTDTPGIIKPAYKLHHAMMRQVTTALDDADIILYVTDVKESGEKNERYIKKLKTINVPVMVAINKSDLSSGAEAEKLESAWKVLLPGATVISISALHGLHVDDLLQEVIRKLPEGPEYYPGDTLTDRNERFFVTEIIRGRIFNQFEQEVPYSCEVRIESYKETDKLVHIDAIIHVMRESQKGILIGHKGAALKKLGTDARADIESFLGRKVYLGLQVKVTPEWRDDDRYLRKFGYLG